MVSTETKATLARVSVVLHIVAAGILSCVLLRLPLFELKVPQLDSSITQSLFFTDIYTPVAEKHMNVIEFTKKCENLQRAFRIAQGSTIAAVVLLSLAFICGLFHLAPSCTKTNHHVRRVCGAPICVLLLLAGIAVAVNGFMVKNMYEKDTWCSNDKAWMELVEAQPAGILRKEGRLATGSAVAAQRFGPRAILLAPPMKLSAVVTLDDNKCDPFKDCISSYREMGFEPAAGYRILWAALGVVFFALVAEMLVMAAGASNVPQAGVTAETAALLSQDDERVI